MTRLGRRGEGECQSKLPGSLDLAKDPFYSGIRARNKWKIRASTRRGESCLRVFGNFRHPSASLASALYRRVIQSNADRHARRIAFRSVSTRHHESPVPGCQPAVPFDSQSRLAFLYRVDAIDRFLLAKVATIVFCRRVESSIDSRI